MSSCTNASADAFARSKSGHPRPPFAFRENPVMRASSPGPARSGARSGALLAAATAASIVANYVFLLAAGRILGSEDYGSLAALLGAPRDRAHPGGRAADGGVARGLARAAERRARRRRTAAPRRAARGCDRNRAAAGRRARARRPLSQLLNIDSVANRRARGAWHCSTALVFPVAMGVLQGQQRFNALAVLYVLPWLVRLAVLGIAARPAIGSAARSSPRSSARSRDVAGPRP